MTELDDLPSPERTRIVAVPARMIPLADGRTWGLAVPTPRYRAEVVPGVDPLGRPTETTRLVARIGYPLVIERLIANLWTACGTAGMDHASDGRRFDALMNLVVALVRRAHDLTLVEAVGLLDLDADGLLRLVDAVLETIGDSSPGPDHPPHGGGNA